MIMNQVQDVSPIPLVIVLGPTAVGKTDFAIQMAQALNGEIISADSRQIYRFMDIGTAKPTADQLALAPHHLIDIVDPDENLGLAQYQRLAYTAIDDIWSRGKLPMLVGGTGQYITAVIEGWSIPEVPPNLKIRAELELFAVQRGSQALHARLEHVDPETATKIEHQNVRRVVRALEVYLETGKPISQLQQKMPPSYRTLQFGLTMDREILHERANHRVDQMMEMGFLDEVHRLLDMGYNRTLPAMSGIGYTQLAAHLIDGVSLERCVENIKTATQQFIRKQYTWFKGHDAGISWLNPLEADIAENIISVARRLKEQA